MSVSLSAYELADQQATVATSYDDLAEVRRLPPLEVRRTRTGGVRQLTPDTVAILPCRLAPGFIPEREQVVGGAITGISSGDVYVAPGAAIYAHDVLVVTNPAHPEWAPIELQVTEVRIRRTNHLERVVTCQRVGNPAPLPVVPLST